MTYHHLIKTMCVGLSIGFIVAVMIGAISLKQKNLAYQHRVACERGDVPDANGNMLCPLVAHER